MYASDLASFLFETIHQADVSHPSWQDFETRMEALRNYGRLPRGRENHATLLSDVHIAAAILGLASDKPGWAGHASLVLGKLRPIGGPDASFRKAPTLITAIEELLRDESARKQLLMVSLSSAESGTNANGAARILHIEDGKTRSANFVSDMALSLLGRGAEKDFNEHHLHSPITRQITFNKRFFEKLAQHSAAVRRLKPGPMSDGREYDAEAAEKRRQQKLGVKPGSRYFNVGVDNQVTWPKEETLVQFDQYTMVLFPKCLFTKFLNCRNCL